MISYPVSGFFSACFTLPVTPDFLLSVLLSESFPLASPAPHVMGSRLLSYQKNTWLRMMCCLQIIWWKNKKFLEVMECYHSA